MREHEHDPVVLREIKRRQPRALVFAELRALLEEEGSVGAESSRDALQNLGREWLLERLVRQAKRRRGVRAPAAKP